jgi:hypothetical protein
VLAQGSVARKSEEKRRAVGGAIGQTPCSRTFALNGDTKAAEAHKKAAYQCNSPSRKRIQPSCGTRPFPKFLRPSTTAGMCPDTRAASRHQSGLILPSRAIVTGQEVMAQRTVHAKVTLRIGDRRASSCIPSRARRFSPTGWIEYWCYYDRRKGHGSPRGQFRSFLSVLE